MPKLTEKAILALACPAPQKDRLVFDDALPGLAVRVSQTGAKAFLVQYTWSGGKRRVPLGRWGAITLEQARTAARVVLGDVAKGADPAREKIAAKQKAKTAAKVEKLTFEVLLGEWEKLALSLRRDTYRREALRALRTAYPGHLAHPAAGLTRDDALKVLDRLARAGKNAIAGRTRAYGRACYGWALRRGMVPENPFHGLPVAAGTVSRDRVLTEGELRAIWHQATLLGTPFGPLVQLLIMTAQRRDEVAGMRWSELSADYATWTIPKERAKNGRAHTVHLPAAARSILNAIDHHAKSDLVFTTNGLRPASGFGKAKLRLDNAIAKQRGKDNPIAPWRFHDFRRTAVTWMAGNGVAPHVADRLLNHVTGTISGVAAVYQRGEFLAERKAALEAWVAHVVPQA